MLRPCLDVTLRGPSGEQIEAPVPALLDSGADRTTFPVEFAEALGIHLSQCRKEPFDSAGGEAEEFVWMSR